MGAPRKYASPVWVRANPYKLSQEELDAIRQTPHLTDLSLPRAVYRALLQAGHRYIGELAYLRPEAVRYLPGLEGFRYYRNLAMIAADLGAEIGSRACE